MASITEVIMKKTIYVYACGGYSDITATVFDTLEEAQGAMKNDYEGMMEGIDECEFCSISSMHAEINIDGMSAADVWGASISVHEIEIHDKWLFVHKDPVYCDDAAIVLSEKEAFDRLHEEVLSMLGGWIDLPPDTAYQDGADAFSLVENEQDISGNELAESIAAMLEECGTDADEIYICADGASLPTGKYERLFYEWSVEEVA